MCASLASIHFLVDAHERVVRAPETERVKG